jgi:hypothetical protein
MSTWKLTVPTIDSFWFVVGNGPGITGVALGVGVGVGVSVGDAGVGSGVGAGEEDAGVKVGVGGGVREGIGWCAGDVCVHPISTIATMTKATIKKKTQKLKLLISFLLNCIIL